MSRLWQHPLRSMLLIILALAGLLSSARMVSADTPVVIATVPVDPAPYGVGVNATTNRIYVTTLVNKSVSVIDGGSNMVIATVPVGWGPHGVGVNATTNRIYVTNEGSSNSVSVIDTSSNTVIATIPVGQSPAGVAVNAITNRIYVVNYHSNVVSVIDGSSNTVITSNVPVGQFPTEVGLNATTNRIYVVNSGSNTVSVIDTSSNTVIATIPVGQSPHDVGVNAITNRVYVTNSTSQSVSVIDGSSNTVIATIPVNVVPNDVGVNATTNRIYVVYDVLNGGGSVLVIDTSSNTVIATIPVGQLPVGVGVNAITNRVYVANDASSSVSVIAENKPPSLVNNNLLTVTSHSTGIIGTALLQTTDPDETPAQLAYTVTTPPTQGTLNLGASFTQAQIDANALSYTNTGSALGDSFQFTVSDGVNPPIGPFTFHITVTLPIITPHPPGPPMGTPPPPFQNLIDTVRAFSLDQGTANSLVAKVQNAASALNRGDVPTAINTLQAFIHEAAAQQGKKLTNAQADQLITQAEVIINSLSAGKPALAPTFVPHRK